MTLDFSAVLIEWPMLLRGLLVTLGLTAAAATFGLLLGIACAILGLALAGLATAILVRAA